jgi:hypothetical protein
MKTSQWAHYFDGEPSEEILRLHFARPRYRLVRSTYRPRLQFTGMMGPGTCYVLRGACRYVFNGAAVTLKTGEFCEVPGGRYEFEALGPGEAEVVRVWYLPGLFAPPQLRWG